MCQYPQQAPEFRPGPAEAASRLRMQSALLSLTIIVNILCLYLVQSDTVIGWIVGALDRARRRGSAASPSPTSSSRWRST